MARKWHHVLFIGAFCLFGHASLAQGTPEEVAKAVVDLATSWPVDMADLPVYAGSINAEIPVPAENLRQFGLEDPWFARAFVHAPFRAPDLYKLSCRRIGKAILSKYRNGAAPTPEQSLFLETIFLGTERLALASRTPPDAEAAMLCEHAFRIDGTDALATRDAMEAVFAPLLSDLTFEFMRAGIPDDLIATRWTGPPDSGIGELRMTVSPNTPNGRLAGKVDIRITTVSWTVALTM